MKPLGAAGMFGLLPLLACAQGGASPSPSASAALMTGVLLERDTTAPSGQFSVRGADNQVFRFQFDRDTRVERENQLLNVPALDPGEKVEVVSESVPGSLVRYARTIRVTSTALPRRPPSPANRPRAYRPVEDRPVPAPFTPSAFSALSTLPPGNLTFAGVVRWFTGERLELHTRAGDQAILLRRDTRYVQDGATVDNASLKPNMRVFIRGGKDLWDQAEAYQVVWGKILDPR